MTDRDDPPERRLAWYVTLAGCIVLPAVWVPAILIPETACTTKPKLTVRSGDGAVEMFWDVDRDDVEAPSRRVWETRRDGEIREVQTRDGERRHDLWPGLDNGRQYVFAVRGKCERGREANWLPAALRRWLPHAVHDRLSAARDQEPGWRYGPWSNAVRVHPSAVESHLSSIDGHLATVSKYTQALNSKAGRIEAVLGASLVSQRGTEADVEIVAGATTKAARLLEAIEPDVDQLVELVGGLNGATTGGSNGGVNVTNVTIGEVAYNDTHGLDSNASGRSPEQRRFGAVYFGSEKDEVRMCEPNCGALTEVLGALQEHEGRVCVEGRASADGPASYNLDLSERRAEAVARWLKCKLKSQPGLEFVTLTAGEEHWRADEFGNDPVNRRVDIYSCPASADAPRSKPVLDADCLGAEDDNAEDSQRTRWDCQQECDGMPVAQN